MEDKKDYRTLIKGEAVSQAIIVNIGTSIKVCCNSRVYLTTKGHNHK